MNVLNAVENPKIIVSLINIAVINFMHRIFYDDLYFIENIIRKKTTYFYNANRLFGLYEIKNDNFIRYAVFYNGMTIISKNNL